MQLWDVINYTPFAAFGGFERDHEAQSHWCVWIKAEFKVAPSGHVSWHDNPELKISPVPMEIETEKGPLVVQDSDISLPKSATDITLSGAARVPARTTTPIRADLKVGDWAKTVEVHPGSKLNARKIIPDNPSPNDEYISLDWTNAYGGMTDTDVLAENPLGTGYAPNREKSDSVTLPRLRYPGDQLRKTTDTLRPVSFLPVPRSWPPRRDLAGTFDEAWMKTRAPLLPSDHNIEYRSTVPADQRYNGFVKGGEWVEMTNIAGPANGTLPKFQIPVLEFDVVTTIDGTLKPTPMTIQTIAFDPGKGLFSMLWCGSIPIGSPANDVKIQKSTIELRSSSGFTASPDSVAKFGEENPTDFGSPPEGAEDPVPPVKEDA